MKQRSEQREKGKGTGDQRKNEATHSGCVAATSGAPVSPEREDLATHSDWVDDSGSRLCDARDGGVVRENRTCGKFEAAISQRKLWEVEARLIKQWLKGVPGAGGSEGRP
jgi:hypothetical protein